MIKKIQDLYKIIPLNFQKKYPFFLLLSCVNAVLDLLAIAYLLPVFLYLLGQESIASYVKISDYLSPKIVLLFIISFILKNIVQIKINKFQTNLLFQIASSLSVASVVGFLENNYLDFQQKSTAKSLEDIKTIGTEFTIHILSSINTMFTEFVLITLILIVSIIVYPVLTIAALVILVVISFFIVKKQKSKIQEINNNLKNDYTTVSAKLLNVINGYLEIKSLGRTLFFKKEFETVISRFNKQYASLKQYQYTIKMVLEIGVVLSFLGLIFVVNYLNFNQENKILFITYLLGISLKLLPSINKFLVAYTNYKSFHYTIPILQKNKFKKDEKKKKLASFKEIELKNIHFSYQKGISLISNINLTIQKGDLISISGKSGVGKTTLVNIMMNLISPQRGSLLLNKEKSSSIDFFSFLNYVPQKTIFFEGTLLDNIVLGQKKEQINFERLHFLAKKLDLEDVVSDYLNTYFDLDSLCLSGGQKQRLSLLRALYTKADVLILDEATNQLNLSLQNKVLSFLLELNKKYQTTIVFISHSNEIRKFCNKNYELTSKGIFSI